MDQIRNAAFVLALLAFLLSSAVASAMFVRVVAGAGRHRLSDIVTFMRYAGFALGACILLVRLSS